MGIAIKMFEPQSEKIYPTNTQVRQYLIHRYFCWKNVSSFCKNISIYTIINDQSFNYTLINDIVSFEHLGPDWCGSYVAFVENES